MSPGLGGWLYSNCREPLHRMPTDQMQIKRAYLKMLNSFAVPAHATMVSSQCNKNAMTEMSLKGTDAPTCSILLSSMP